MIECVSECVSVRVKEARARGGMVSKRSLAHGSTAQHSATRTHSTHRKNMTDVMTTATRFIVLPTLNVTGLMPRSSTMYDAWLVWGFWGRGVCVGVGVCVVGVGGWGRERGWGCVWGSVFVFFWGGGG